MIGGREARFDSPVDGIKATGYNWICRSRPGWQWKTKVISLHAAVYRVSSLNQDLR